MRSVSNGERKISCLLENWRNGQTPNGLIRAGSQTTVSQGLPSRCLEHLPRNELSGVPDARRHAKSRFPPPTGPANRLCARLTDEQATKAQEIELRAAGCDTIIQEHGSGASRFRPALSKLVREIGAGDTLVVVRLDRLARSVSHLLEVIEDLTARNAHFRSLREPPRSSASNASSRC